MTNGHWTNKDTKSFSYSIASDFIEQLRDRLEEIQWSQARLAKELKVTRARVSQVFGNPGNLTLETMIEWARIVGMKVSIVAYFDSDPTNEWGPVNAEMFRQSWVKQGRPRSFFDLRRDEKADESVG